MEFGKPKQSCKIKIELFKKLRLSYSIAIYDWGLKWCLSVVFVFITSIRKYNCILSSYLGLQE